MKIHKLIYTIIIPIIGIIIPIAVFLAGTAKKELSFFIQSQTEIVDVNKYDISDLSVLYKEKVLRNLHLFELQIENTGNVPIESKDFERNLSISFGNKSVLLLAQSANSMPSSLTPRIILKQHWFEVEPLLLNPDDQITFEAFITGGYEPPKLDMRISGIKQPVIVGGNKDETPLKIMILLLTSLFGIFLYTYFFRGLQLVFFGYAEKNNLFPNSILVFSCIVFLFSSVTSLKLFFKYTGIDFNSQPLFFSSTFIIPTAIGFLLARRKRPKIDKNQDFS